MLHLLGRRLTPDEAHDLASQLPGDLAGAVTGDSPRETYGEKEFLRRLADKIGVTEETAIWDASAVLSGPP